MRKTKIVITMGPALMEGDRLWEALKIADVVRLNASHSDCESRTPVLSKIRQVLMELGRTVPVFLDLQGPKWRLGLFDTPFEAPTGSVGAFYFADTQPPAGVPWSAPVPHPELFLGAKVGQRWLVDDGALVFEIAEVNDRYVTAKTITGGTVKQRKGVMPIGLDVQFDPLTKKDLEDIAWGVKENVDLFAQSFVRQVSDLRSLEEAIKAAGGNQFIIAKIEHPKALDNLEGILEASWGVMVARGDLGVEIGVEKVPTLQKRIIQMARQNFKPVITATQMLESMIEHPSPTRAESSDVANAIWDGTDAVMLSAESAAGKYPLESIRWLAKIAEDADTNTSSYQANYRQIILSSERAAQTDVNIALAACNTAKEIGARYIVAFTEGGGIVRMISHMAGNTPIIAATTSPGIARRLGVVRNVRTLLTPRAEHMSELLALATPILRATFDINPGDKVVMTIGHPLWTSGTTNTMRVIVF
ncbi:MAG: pyruvate kinase [Holophagales bacterium]|nr:pyruvate kinase [Holophagales bacterium]